jgi:hypothetical protein
MSHQAKGMTNAKSTHKTPSQKIHEMFHPSLVAYLFVFLKKISDFEKMMERNPLVF